MLLTVLLPYILLLHTVHSFDHNDCYTTGGEYTMCAYMKQYAKNYLHKQDFELKKKNILSRMTHNTHSTDLVKFGLNSGSDKTFHANVHLQRSRPDTRPDTDKHVLRLSSNQLPDDLDLRDKMQPIKNQMECGSCYVFAAVSVLEYHAGVSLSEQKLMDCSSSDNGPSYGCDGGWPTTLFEYAMNQPIVSESDQPYLGENQACNQTCGNSLSNIKTFGTIDSIKDPASETRIPYILNTHGPVVVAIDVGTTELLMSYIDGIFPGIACGTEQDHAVTIVGYTPEYWIIRNSWGVDWGDGGYFYLERGINACGVADSIGYII